jgi:hypothetical protein
MTMTKRAQLISLAAIAALSLFNGAARADDGGGQYDDFPMTVAVIGVSYESDAPVTCAEAERDAQFLRQLKLSEGDGEPSVTPAECRTDDNMIAAAGEQDE